MCVICGEILFRFHELVKMSVIIRSLVCLTHSISSEIFYWNFMNFVLMTKQTSMNLATVLLHAKY